MSDQEKIMMDLRELSSADLLRVKMLISDLKRHRSKKMNKEDKPYLRVRQALKNVKANLSREVISERDDRI